MVRGYQWTCRICGDDSDTPVHDQCAIHGGIITKGGAVMDVQHMGGPIWKAEGSKSGVWYDIDMDVPKCSCQGYIFKNGKQGVKSCKHIEAIKAKTVNVVNGDLMDAQEKARVKARTQSILSRFEDRESSPQEDALREALAKKKK